MSQTVQPTKLRSQAGTSLLETMVGLAIFAIFCTGVATIMTKTTQTNNMFSAKSAAIDESAMVMAKITSYVQKRNVYSATAISFTSPNLANSYYHGIAVLMPDGTSFRATTACQPLATNSPILTTDFTSVGAECLDTPCPVGSAPVINMYEPALGNSQFPHLSGSTSQRPVAMALCLTVPTPGDATSQSQFDVFTTLLSAAGQPVTTQKNTLLPLMVSTNTSIMYLP